VRGKEGFNKTVKRGAGHLANKAKREEYERLMREKKKTPPAEADEVPKYEKMNCSVESDSRYPSKFKKNPQT
jgi:hypothetical protein